MLSLSVVQNVPFAKRMKKRRDDWHGRMPKRRQDNVYFFDRSLTLSINGIVLLHLFLTQGPTITTCKCTLASVLLKDTFRGHVDQGHPWDEDAGNDDLDHKHGRPCSWLCPSLEVRLLRICSNSAIKFLMKLSDDANVLRTWGEVLISLDNLFELFLRWRSQASSFHCCWPHG